MVSGSQEYNTHATFFGASDEVATKTVRPRLTSVLVRKKQLKRNLHRTLGYEERSICKKAKNLAQDSVFPSEGKAVLKERGMQRQINNSKNHPRKCTR